MLDVRRPSQHVRVLCYRVRCGPARVLGALGDSSQPVARVLRPELDHSSMGACRRDGLSAADIDPVSASLTLESSFLMDGVSEEETPSASQAGSDDEEEGDTVLSMSEEEAKRKIGEDSKEFFAICDLDEAEEQATKLNEGPLSR
ncbi:hypothetical protein NEOLEDRAFT_1184617 [Neolentinus lepideus HHB14362 ss-1]|uniref:Uncharacterized protein n=1 Tax=Neolentinus lepideus HHB14362 ss-1 TaxID=1314782 RepID=A0A165M9E4_9AGAM|nr:hypothetical protein NEOLEDRAFT_1184617 [Neolentinus lepideus HHB14362 ss-1]